MFDQMDGVSQAQAARKFNCRQQYISKILKTKLQIRVFKKKKIPKRSEAQQAKIQTLCGRLFTNMSKKSSLLDDESYFTLSHSTINGNGNFYSSDVSKAPASIKYRSQIKFEKKVLVWLCISDKGMSEPYFVPSGLAVNQQLYLAECIKKRLIPFIKKYHSDDQYLFWPDLASSHYAKSVTSYLTEQKINFVQKKDNPPSLPEARAIEDFWSILKGKVYKNNWQAKDLPQLITRIKKCLREIDPKLVQALAKSTQSRLDKIRRNNIIELN